MGKREKLPQHGSQNPALSLNAKTFYRKEIARPLRVSTMTLFVSRETLRESMMTLGVSTETLFVSWMTLGVSTMSLFGSREALRVSSLSIRVSTETLFVSWMTLGISSMSLFVSREALRGARKRFAESSVTPGGSTVRSGMSPLIRGMSAEEVGASSPGCCCGKAGPARARVGTRAARVLHISAGFEMRLPCRQVLPKFSRAQYWRGVCTILCRRSSSFPLRRRAGAATGISARRTRAG